jgi:signal transduction histidine kinase
VTTAESRRHGRLPVRGRAREWAELARAHPRAADAALATACWAGAVLSSGPGAVVGSGLLGSGLLCAPLVWRRRYPPLVFVATWLGVLVHVWLSGPGTADGVVIIALLGVAVHCRRRWLLAALVLAQADAVAVALAVRTGQPETPLAVRAAPQQVVVAVWAVLALVLVLAGVLGTSVQAQRRYLAVVADRAARAESEAHHRALLAAAQERAHLAREMHDVVSHSVSVMIALVDGASATVGRDPARARQAMERAGDVGRQALQEMRGMLVLLRLPRPTDAADRAAPAVADLEALIDRVRDSGLPIECTVSGTPIALPPGVQLALYRVLQEALTNSIKHASGTTVRIAVDYRRDGTVSATVQDTGPSPAAGAPASGAAGAPAAGGEEPAHRLGYGLTGMTERAVALGGGLTAGPCAGGWRVEVWLPAHDRDGDRP